MFPPKCNTDIAFGHAAGWHTLYYNVPVPIFVFYVSGSKPLVQAPYDLLLSSSVSPCRYTTDIAFGHAASWHTLSRVEPLLLNC